MPAKGTTRREPWNPILKSYPFSERVNAVSVGAETLFTRLVAQADDYGNYYGSPVKILAYLYGHRFAAGHVTATDTGRWRTELVSNKVGPLICMYSIQGEEYLHLINPRRRIRKDVAPDIRFPREPANIEEKAILEQRIENGPGTGRGRCARLDLDLDKTQTRLDPEKLLVEKDSTDLFEIFWKEFLTMKRNDGKIAARKAWITTTVNGRTGKVNGHKPIDPSVILNAAKNYREFCIAEGTAPNMIKLPATFVGPDRHWEDWKNHRKPSSNGSGGNSGKRLIDTGGYRHGKEDFLRTNDSKEES